MASVCSALRARRFARCKSRSSIGGRATASSNGRKSRSKPRFSTMTPALLTSFLAMMATGVPVAIAIKAMKDKGYDIGFSVGVTAASATLGPIIPPSLLFVIYGMMANVSVGQLFLAGIIPGVVMALLMMLTVAYYAHKYGWGGDVRFEWPRLLKALSELAIVIGFPLLMW